MSEPYVGEIRMFAGTFAPVGWAFCNGAELNISEHDVLFTLIGTTYGGNGQTTFALPDLRGRLPVGQGTGPGLTPRVIGETFGSETVSLLPQHMPAHNHAFHASKATADNGSPENGLLATTSADNVYVPAPDNPEPKTMTASTITAAGAGQPHDNIMRSVAMNYIICLVGLYPSRN